MSSPRKVPQRPLGRKGPSVSVIGLGAMGFGSFYGSSDETESMKTLYHAADRGMTFWDTADIYGGSEELIGKWFKESGRRPEIFLATKWGAFKTDLPPEELRNAKPDSKPSYIRHELARSLEHLQTSYIDLYYQHRVDPEVPIEIVMEALREPVLNGTIRWIGLCECSAEHIRRAKADPKIGSKVIACQVEFSPFELHIEKSGLADACEEMGVSIVAYSPLGRGMISGRYRTPADLPEGDLRHMLPRFAEENFSRNMVLVDALAEIAKKYNVSSSQLALAWILAEHSNFVPIPGCRNEVRVEENASAAEITLDPEDVKRIRALVESADVAGERKPPFMFMLEDSIPREQYHGEMP